MKRLETLLPHLVVGQFDKNNQSYTLKESGKVLFASPLAFSFMQLCNGSYSVKEICLLVYARESSFSFIDIMKTLEAWAEEKAFRNSQDILDSIKADFKVKTGPIEMKPLSEDQLLLALRKVSLFSNFSEAALKHIISVSTQKKYQTGEPIILRGTEAEDAYVVLGGRVGVFLQPFLQNGKPIAEITPMNIFGESAAITNQKRTADVNAVLPSLVLKIPISQIKNPELSGGLSKNLRLRLIFSQMIKTHPLFRHLPGDVIQLLLSGCRIEKCPAQSTVIQQGDQGQDFYFIISGSVMVVKDSLPEAQLGPGNYFGEMGGLLKRVRSASVITQTESIFLVLAVKNFIGILASHLHLAVEIEKTALARDQKAIVDPVSDEITLTDEITMEIRNSLSEIEDFDFSVTAPQSGENE